MSKFACTSYEKDIDRYTIILETSKVVDDLWVQHGGWTHTCVLRRFLSCLTVPCLLCGINHRQIDGEGCRVCEEASICGMVIF